MPSHPHARPTVLFVVGTRPEAIKMLPVIRAFRERAMTEPIVISTGQHTALVREVLALAGIEPDVEFPAGAPGRSLNELVAHVMTHLDSYVRSEFGESPAAAGYPVASFVHGDTSSAAAAALASFQLRIPVAHIEAGLRTSDTLSPFPEELNRQLIARIASAHFAPTNRNQENLIREGVPSSKIFVTGNTGIDALLWASGLQTPYGRPELSDLEADEASRLVVVTAHRRENWGAGLHGIGGAVHRLAVAHPEVRFVLPLHPNPAVATTLRGLLGDDANVSLVDPMEYTAFARLLGRATLVITDSGGIQEEAPAIGVPVLVARETTERQEGVEAGTLELVGTDADTIVAAAERLLGDAGALALRSGIRNPYGDGRAAERIVLASEHIAFGTEAPAPFGTPFNRHEILRSAGLAIGADGTAEYPIGARAS